MLDIDAKRKELYRRPRTEIFGHIGAFIARLLLSLRYRVKLKGLEKIPWDKGVLFLPNHPSHFDSLMVITNLWPRFQPRPMAIDYCYFLPVWSRVLKYVRAIPVPNFDEGFSPIKMRRMEAILEEAGDSLEQGANLVIYPSGNLMRGPKDEIGGASGLHMILKQHPGCKVVLVRTTGLWGSIAGTAHTGGVSPKPIPLLKQCFKILLKNLVFFTPKRDVEIEFEVAPEEFPRNTDDKMVLNRWLDHWYFKDGPQELKQVSLCRWWNEFPESMEKQKAEFNLEDVSPEIQEAVKKELADRASKNAKDLEPEMLLSNDLGLDSLDRSEVLIWLQEKYFVQDVGITELITVGSVMEVAASGGGKSEESVELQPPEEWEDPNGRPQPIPPRGQSIQEAFLRCADYMNGTICMADEPTGVLGWTKFKMACLLMADVLKELDEDRVGIMMPATVGAGIMVHGALLAGKTPVMINWTLGPRNLEHVKELSGIKVVLSSLRFVEKLGNTELGPLETNLLFIEDLKSEEFTLERKIRALMNAFKPADVLLDELGLKRINPDSESVILFTSGSESVPKGVPLSHRNILTNLSDVFKKFRYLNHDVIMAFLPPFHSFGYVITTILPTICGVKVAYHPNPTDSRKLARLVKYWSATLLYGTPSFISSIFKAADPGQLKKIEFIKVGAEKAPDELFLRVKDQAPEARMVEGYGITECSPILTINEPNGERQGVGFPFPSVQIRIVHPETYEDLEEGAVGMIVAHGASIFNGYLGNPRSDVFLEKDGVKWYVTGDLGYINQNGAIILAGRKKRFVKVAGEMVSLPALESVLIERWPPGEEGPSVAVEALEIEGERPVLCLFSVEELSLDVANQLLKDSGFSNVARLNRVEQIPMIPVLGTGKTDYRGLKKILEEKVNS